MSCPKHHCFSMTSVQEQGQNSAFFGAVNNIMAYFQKATSSMILSCVYVEQGFAKSDLSHLILWTLPFIKINNFLTVSSPSSSMSSNRLFHHLCNKNRLVRNS